MTGHEIQWFLNRDGQQHGPIRAQEMQALLAMGHLRPTDYVWHAGLTNWTLAGELPELAAPHQPLSPPPFRPPSRAIPDAEAPAYDVAPHLADAPASVPTTARSLWHEVVPHLANAPSAKEPSTNAEIDVEKSLRVAGWLKWTLIVGIIITAASLLSNIMQFILLSDFKEGGYAGRLDFNQAAESNDYRQSVVAMANAVLVFITIPLFCVWIYRANKAARQLGATEMKYTPGWAVGWYFIPLANLWMPYMAMKEIWKASKNPRDWQDEPHDSMLPTWWFFFLCSGFAGNASLRYSLNAKTMDQILASTGISIAFDILYFLATITAIIITQQINEFQSKQHLHASTSSQVQRNS